MSPTAMSRSTTVLDHGHDGPAANGSAASLKLGADGGGGGGDRRGKRILPHIDDITQVSVDLDSYTPIDKILNTAESFLRQAESSNSFGRPDFALRDYIKATIIVVDVIKRNKGWVSLQSDNKTQLERYLRIVRQVNASHEVFEKIKADIKADNARTGVQPTVHRSSNPAAPHRDEGASITSGRIPSDRGSIDSATWKRPSAPSTQKVKPVVHPKPQALHGNAIKPVGGGPPPASKAAQDLAQRFANLRSKTTSPGQDPRIRTQPIVTSRTADGRDDASDSSSRASFAADHVMPDLPKMPDAIYSPARGTVSNEAAELPSSTPRGIFSRTNSTVSFSNGSSAAMKSSSPLEDYFNSSYSSGGANALPAKGTKPTIPEGDTISAQDLVELMRYGSKDFSILLIDIRSREDFDEGHILSQATICIDTEVLSRDNISANEIADSMVLAPTHEQLLFERRHSFDMLVFYDQHSSRINWRPNTASERAISGIYNALSHYDFAGRETATRRPKLLEGGIDAWSNLMGKVSLQTSTTAVTAPRRYRDEDAPVSVHKVPVFRPNPRRKYVTRPIQDADEARRWEETLNSMESFSPVRTTDDFLRRFPSVSTMQESMASPPESSPEPPSSVSNDTPTRAEELFPSWPSPPQRPAPTVPRPSYSGLAESDNRDELVRALKTSSRERGGKERKLVGLVNPGNWCYGNSSLQAMFGTPGFAADLWSGDWQEQYKVPMKHGEKIQHPQLMAKMLANLFYWMDKGNFEVMEARTLMKYLFYIHMGNSSGTGRKKDPTLVFGGSCQQDAQEYFSFIIDQLHDETNRFRDKPVNLTTVKDNDPKSLLHNAIEFWNTYSTKNDSIVDKYWRGLLVQGSGCKKCGHHTMNFQVSDLTTLGISSPNQTLESMLAEYTATEIPEGFKCYSCGSEGRERRLTFARMPDRFAVAFQRFHRDLSTSTTSKVGHRVVFPIQDLDLTPYFIGAGDQTIEGDDAAATIAREDRHFRGPFKYDCYAVMCHIGSDLGSGHYIAYVNDETSADPTDWIKFNDSRVTRVKVGTGGRGDELEKMYKDGNQQAYMVFYKRKSA